MNSKLVFISSFIKNPKEVAAVAQSSRYLIKRIIKNINFKNAKCIVEYGPGTGVVTKALLSNISRDAMIICFELNPKLYHFMDKSIKDPRLVVINDDAEKADYYLKKLKINEIDYALSGLPFSLINKESKKSILKKTKSFLKRDGKFIVYQQYNGHLRSYLKDCFEKVSTSLELRNIPPSYFYICEKT